MVNYNYLRPKKAEAVRKWYGNEMKKKDELTAESYYNATILPLNRINGDNLCFGRGGVVDEDGNYLKISNVMDRIDLAYEYDEAVYCDGKVVYCGYMVPQWGHFLVEGVTRLWYFLKNDTTVDKYVFFLGLNETREIKGNYREFLELLGVWDKVEFINKPTRYREVIVPERSYAIWNHWSEEYKKTFDALAANVQKKPDWKPAKKVFLSRAKIKGVDKKEYNMDMLDEFFAKNGFEVIYPENYSLANLIFLFQNAETVATMSGSVQHNMMLAPDGIKHIVLEKTVMTVDFTIDINRMKNFDVTYIDSNLVIYPVSIGYGPYIQIYSGYLKKFAEDQGWKPADPRFEDPSRMKNFLKRYMRVYRAEYQYKWYIADWEIEFAASIKEACDDGYRYFEPYLSRQKPFLWHHYFELHYWKMLARKVIKRS